MIADIDVVLSLPGPESDTGTLALHSERCPLLVELNDKLTWRISLFCNHVAQIVSYRCLCCSQSEDDITFRSALQSASFQFMQTAFDSCALALIMWKTFRESMQSNSIHGIKRVILKHGILYYM